VSSAELPEPSRPVFDELDRRIIACLQADGRASWTAIAKRSGTSLATAARRGQRLLANETVRVAVAPTNIHHGRSTMFMMRMTCRAGAQPSVAAQLASHPKIRFLALVSGRYDLIAEVCANSDESLFRQLVSEYQGIEGVDWCETDLILREHKVAQDWSWQLLAGESDATTVREPHACDASHLDDYDRKIVEVLRDDGRLPFSAVASRVGLDETTVRRRFETFSTRGCVRTLTLVPAAALGFTSELILDVSVEPAKLHTVASQMTHFPGVRFVADTLNGSSLLCELIQPSEQALHSFLTDTLATLDGVRGWEASMELLTIRRGFVETPWWREVLPQAAITRATITGATITEAKGDGMRASRRRRSAPNRI
jgi:DNA-binding Lrp family transcriptional regulator